MGVTSIYSLPYPETTDAPHGPNQIKALAESVDAKLHPNFPVAHMIQISAQSIPHATATPVTFTSESFDTDLGHDTATNTSRYVSQRSGYYALSGAIAFAASATGFRAITWARNGTEINGSHCSADALAHAGAVFSLTARSIMVSLAIGDYVEMMAYHESGGGSLSTSVVGVARSTMSVAYLRST